ncbi:MAG: GspH/FimT family pseudopilin [Paucibacter sp.]|nr:GspH/FimT family pseudopilin [Roseateles sp.]
MRNKALGLPRRRLLGLSLIELCVVLAIVAVLLAAAVPNFQRSQAHQRLLAAASALSADIQNARSLAVRRIRRLHIHFGQADGGTCYLVHDGQSSECRCGDASGAACSGKVQPLRYVWLPAASQLSLSANNDEIAINPNQGTITPTATVSLRHANGETIHTIVSIAGRVRTCSPTGAMSSSIPGC